LYICTLHKTKSLFLALLWLLEVQVGIRVYTGTS